MIFYIDSNYKCHVSPGDGLRTFKDEHFDGKCREYIEGFRYIPNGESYRENGVEYAGEQLFPWLDLRQLEAAQAEYEHLEYERLRRENAEYEAALSAIENALGVTSE